MGAVVEYGNVTAKVSGVTDEKVLAALEAKLSYEVGGFGVPRATRLLFKRETGLTYTGLVPYVLQVLKKFNVAYKVVDRRVRPAANTPMSLVDAITPRDYQQKILDNDGTRLMVQCATGGGKSLVLAGFIAKFDVTPVVVLSNNEALVHQLAKEFSRFLGREVGVMTGSVKRPADVTVGTPQALLKWEGLAKAKALLVDECQRLGSATMFAVARQAVNAYYRVAVSATPWRDGPDDLLIEAAVTVRDPRATISASTLIRKGNLTPCAINFIRVPAVNAVGTYDKKYAAAISENPVRNQMVVDVVRREAVGNDAPTLVLFNTVAHGRRLERMIKAVVPSKKSTLTVDGRVHEVDTVELIDGSTPIARRNAVLEATRQGKVRVLLGSTIADEGLDCPPLAALVLAGGGKSTTRAFQRVGRVLRLFKGKVDARVYDFADETPVFSDHYLVRRALYEVEPEWARNLHVVDSVGQCVTKALRPLAA